MRAAKNHIPDVGSMDRRIIDEAAEILDVLTSKIPKQHPIRLHAQQRAKEIVEALYQITSGHTQQELLHD